MLLFLFLFLFLLINKIDIIFCSIQNKNENILNEINSQRKQSVQIDLTLQLAAYKRCTNRDELLQTYESIFSKNYRNDDWPRQEQLNKKFSDGNKRSSDICLSLSYNQVLFLSYRNDLFQWFKSSK